MKYLTSPLNAAVMVNLLIVIISWLDVLLDRH